MVSTKEARSTAASPVSLHLATVKRGSVWSSSHVAQRHLRTTLEVLSTYSDIGDFLLVRPFVTCPQSIQRGKHCTCFLDLEKLTTSLEGSCSKPAWHCGILWTENLQLLLSGHPWAEHRISHFIWLHLPYSVLPRNKASSSLAQR